MAGADELDRDFRIAELYMGFSAELLRLALVGIGLFGFLLTEHLVRLEQLTEGKGRSAFALGLVCLVICACAALAHRYLAGESMAYQVSVLRTRAVCQAAPEADRARWRSELEREKARWHARLRWSGRSIALGSAALACGIVSIAVGFVLTG